MHHVSLKIILRIKLILLILASLTVALASTSCNSWHYLIKYNDNLWILYEEIANNTIKTTIYAYNCEIVLIYPAKVEPYENFTVYINVTNLAWAKDISVSAYWVNKTMDLVNKSPQEAENFTSFYWKFCTFHYTYDAEIGNLRKLVAIKHVIAPPIIGSIMMIYVDISRLAFSEEMEYLLSNLVPPSLKVKFLSTTIATTPLLGSGSILDKYISYGILKNKYFELNSKYLNLLENCTRLEKLYANLNHNYTNVLAAYQKLQKNYTILKKDYDDLQSNYQRTVQENNYLKDRLSNLEILIENISEENKKLRNTLTITILFFVSLITAILAIRGGKKSVKG